MLSSVGTDAEMFGDGTVAEERAMKRPASETICARRGINMKTRSGRVGAASKPAALFHVVLRGCRPEALVREEGDWRKMADGIDTMLFWCGGRILGLRCEADRVELAIETALVPLGNMLRYVTVPYALHFNRARSREGQVFRPMRVYRLQRAFRTDFILWLHRPLKGGGWTADDAYLDPASMPWVDASAVLEELGRGPGARRQYRALRARGVEEELALAFASPRATLPHIRHRVRPAQALRKRRQRVLLRSVVRFVAEREEVSALELASRSRARRICHARCLVTLVAVRCGVSLAMIGALLGRDGSTLQESVLRLRARDPDGLLSAAEAILAAMGTDESALGEADLHTRAGVREGCSAEDGEAEEAAVPDAPDTSEEDQ